MPLTAIAIADSVRVNVQATESQLSPENMLNFVNQAIDMGKVDNLYQIVSDETLTELADTYEYALTGGVLAELKYIYSIHEQDDDDTAIFRLLIPRNYWTLRYASVPQIYFYDHLGWSPVADKVLRITGGKTMARISDPDDTVYLPEAYVIWRATAFAHSALAAGAGPRAQWHERQIPIANQWAEVARIGATEYRVPPQSYLVPNR